MAKTPTSVRVRTYQVGFGDCFLLTFNYPDDKRHVLIDFGSTGLPDGAPKNLMMMIAEDIRTECGGKNGKGGKLHAVVATHRHKDHISGFETKNGKGTGDIIASLKPDVVVQPWTEDPDLATNATAPSGRGAGNGIRALNAVRIQALAAMQAVAAVASKMAKSPQYRNVREPELKALVSELAFLGEDNIANPSAVRNLMKMAPNKYVYFGANSGLGSVLPGVKVDVLGPPTLKQEKRIAKERRTDRDEFWHLQQAAMALAPVGGKAASLFPRHVVNRGGPRIPIDARWMVYHASRVQAAQALQIVRILDKAMNNTSVILLFQIGNQLLLFPGDAQIENWAYALADDDVKKRLRNVSLYKVGHHGSLNATPKSLWEIFKLRDRAKTGRKKLVSLMSTMAGKHGHEDSGTEVPRRPLVKALDSETKLFSTQSLSGGAFFHDETIKISSQR